MKNLFALCNAVRDGNSGLDLNGLVALKARLDAYLDLIHAEQLEPSDSFLDTLDAYRGILESEIHIARC